MFNIIIEFFKKRKIKKHLDKDFYFIIELFSIVTYLDKEIKDIEIIDSDLLLENLIKIKHPELDLHETSLFKTFGHEIYINNLKKFKSNEEYFQLKKQEILSTLKINKKNSLNKYVFMLINSDGIIANEESCFIRELKNLNKGNYYV